MLLRYVDGPWEGDTVETTCSVVVDRPAYVARFDGWGDRWRRDTGEGGNRYVPVEDEHAQPPVLLSEATVPEILTELAARGLRRPVATPMRRRREAYPRSGFGQRWPGDG